MVTRLHLFLITAVSLILTSIVLVIYTEQREQEFLDHQVEIQKAMVEGAARDINYQLSNQILHVHLFNDEYRELIRKLAIQPNDKFTRDIIERRLQQRLAHAKSFTITTNEGTPILDDFDLVVGNICKRDINNFVIEAKRVKKDVQNPIFIHPQADNYHYDIMATIKDPYYGANNVFFVSFDPAVIQEILKTREIPGHRLMLVKTDDDALIEITANGTRDSMPREGQLTKEEMITIKTSQQIPGTNWTMIDLQDPEYEKAYIERLWKEAGSLLLIVLLSNLFIFMIFSMRIKYAEVREGIRGRSK